MAKITPVDITTLPIAKRNAEITDVLLGTVEIKPGVMRNTNFNLNNLGSLVEESVTEEQLRELVYINDPEGAQNLTGDGTPEDPLGYDDTFIREKLLPRSMHPISQVGDIADERLPISEPSISFIYPNEPISGREVVFKILGTNEENIVTDAELITPVSDGFNNYYTLAKLRGGVYFQTNQLYQPPLPTPPPNSAFEPGRDDRFPVLNWDNYYVSNIYCHNDDLMVIRINTRFTNPKYNDNFRYRGGTVLAVVETFGSLNPKHHRIHYINNRRTSIYYDGQTSTGNINYLISNYPSYGSLEHQDDWRPKAGGGYTPVTDGFELDQRFGLGIFRTAMGVRIVRRRMRKGIEHSSPNPKFTIDMAFVNREAHDGILGELLYLTINGRASVSHALEGTLKTASGFVDTRCDEIVLLDKLYTRNKSPYLERALIEVRGPTDASINSGTGAEVNNNELYRFQIVTVAPNEVYLIISAKPWLGSKGIGKVADASAVFKIGGTGASSAFGLDPIINLGGTDKYSNKYPPSIASLTFERVKHTPNNHVVFDTSSTLSVYRGDGKPMLHDLDFRERRNTMTFAPSGHVLRNVTIDRWLFSSPPVDVSPPDFFGDYMVTPVKNSESFAITTQPQSSIPVSPSPFVIGSKDWTSAAPYFLFANHNSNTLVVIPKGIKPDVEYRTRFGTESSFGLPLDIPRSNAFKAPVTSFFSEIINGVNSWSGLDINFLTTQIPKKVVCVVRGGKFTKDDQSAAFFKTTVVVEHSEVTHIPGNMETVDVVKKSFKIDLSGFSGLDFGVFNIFNVTLTVGEIFDRQVLIVHCVKKPLERPLKIYVSAWFIEQNGQGTWTLVSKACEWSESTQSYSNSNVNRFSLFGEAKSNKPEEISLILGLSDTLLRFPKAGGPLVTIYNTKDSELNNRQYYTYVTGVGLSRLSFTGFDGLAVTASPLTVGKNIGGGVMENGYDKSLMLFHPKTLDEFIIKTNRPITYCINGREGEFTIPPKDIKFLAPKGTDRVKVYISMFVEDANTEPVITIDLDGNKEDTIGRVLVAVAELSERRINYIDAPPIIRIGTHRLSGTKYPNAIAVSNSVVSSENFTNWGYLPG